MTTVPSTRLTPAHLTSAPVRPGVVTPYRAEPGRRTAKALAEGTVTAARFVGHFAVACVSVVVLGADADL
jgi:hypothetical protein